MGPEALNQWWKKFNGRRPFPWDLFNFGFACCLLDSRWKAETKGFFSAWAVQTDVWVTRFWGWGADRGKQLAWEFRQGLHFFILHPFTGWKEIWWRVRSQGIPGQNSCLGLHFLFPRSKGCSFPSVLWNPSVQFYKWGDKKKNLIRVQARAEAIRALRSWGKGSGTSFIWGRGKKRSLPTDANS